eukprot:TRINITY_DN26378_c0_g1_i1.p1 TRINITY_DN26378_c0_g1~~TRINITY_DN26378_c0_g1_i1.p1  ORF type:complete len:373 (+),score=52.33 TRINITY_DN26378_c0_g1_i1:101-1219(+)
MRQSSARSLVSEESGQSGALSNRSLLMEGKMEGSSDSDGDGSGSGDHDHIVTEHSALQEDIFSLAIMSAVRDTVGADKGSSYTAAHVARVATSLTLCFGNIALQTFLIIATKRYVCLPAVLSIRENYNAFEEVMYDNHTKTYDDIFVVGLGEERLKRFNTMPEIMQKKICNIPLSQPLFLQVVLLIWTMTCVGEIRRCIEQLHFFVVAVPTLPSMQDSIMANPSDDHQKLVKGLTRQLKLLIGAFILLPRIILTCLLLWVGCRWLTATTSFGDILIDAIALEFVLLTKDLMYYTVVPQRSQLDVKNTVIKYTTVHEKSLQSFLGSLLWLMLAIGWVYLYCFKLQRVIPYFGWDVSIVCSEWLDNNFPGAAVF